MIYKACDKELRSFHVLLNYNKVFLDKITSFAIAY